MNTKGIEFTASNLEKLADYIEQNVSQDQLNSESFRSSKNVDFAYFHSIDDSENLGFALGWSPFHPDMPAKDWMLVNVINVRSFFERYHHTYYTALPLYGVLHNKAFGPNQSSDKPSVVRRLREVANELRERAA